MVEVTDMNGRTAFVKASRVATITEYTQPDGEAIAEIRVPGGMSVSVKGTAKEVHAMLFPSMK